MRWCRPGRGRWGWRVVAGIAVVSGCIGTTDREDFDGIIQQRGGGFTSELPLDAVEAVAGELGVDDFELRGMTIDPPSEMVVLDVRDPAVAGNLDRYVVRHGDIESTEPIRLTTDDDLDLQTFPVSGLALDQVESMVDAALAGFDPGGYASSMTVSRVGEGDASFRLALESDRATATAQFTADGELVEVTRL